MTVWTNYIYVKTADTETQWKNTTYF